ncbi:hypothetical protein CSUI_007468, partial [Cystoisospora suis]
EHFRCQTLVVRDSETPTVQFRQLWRETKVALSTRVNGAIEAHTSAIGCPPHSALVVTAMHEALLSHYRPPASYSEYGARVDDKGSLQPDT